MMSTKIPDSISPPFLLFIILSVFILLFQEKKKVNIRSDILYPKVILLFLKKQKSAHSPLLKEMEYWVFCSSLFEESALKINLANWI